MNNLPNPEEIYEKWVGINAEMQYKLTPKEDFIEAMKEYGRQVRDKTLDWCTENVIGDLDFGINGKLNTAYVDIDKNSILAGKTHKDLEI